jgi:hypothetical protein
MNVSHFPSDDQAGEEQLDAEVVIRRTDVSATDTI